jgi:diguanylate cyclase (GGDEF)-like protein
MAGRRRTELLARAVAALGVPAGVLRRIQWISLAMVLAYSLITLLLVVSGQVSTRPNPWLPLPFLAVPGLAVCWLRAYRRGGFTVSGDLAQALLLLAACTGDGESLATNSLAQLGAVFRGMYGSARRCLAVALLWQAAITGSTAVKLWSGTVSGPEYTVATSLWPLVGILVLGALAFFVARVVAKYEQTVARDQVVLRAGADLVAAGTRQEIYAVVERVAAALLDQPSGQAMVCEPDGAVASPRAGPGLDALPEPARAAIASARVLYVRPGAGGVWTDERRTEERSEKGRSEEGRRRLTRPRGSRSRSGRHPTRPGDQGPPQSLEPSGETAASAVVMPLESDDDRAPVLVCVADTAPSRQVLAGLAALQATVALALRSTRLTEDLQRQAFEDALTGLANRAMFRDRLRHATARLVTEPGRVALLLLDLDGFKNVNDTLGHAAGDRLLVAVSDRLRMCVRSSDTVARLGGDEFTVIVENISGPEDAAKVAVKILAVLGQPLDLGDVQVQVRGSIGIAVGDAASSGEDLLVAADLAMYQAKADGKARYRMYEPAMGAAISRPPAQPVS